MIFSKIFFTKTITMLKNSYRKLFERSEDSILIIVGDNLEDCNASAVKMFGYKNKKDFLNSRLSQLSPKYQPNGCLSYEKANEKLAIAIDNGSHRFEWYHMRADRENFLVEVSLTIVTVDNQQIIQAVLRDITMQKKAEEEKFETEKKLKAIINHRFQLTGLLDSTGKLLMANENVYKLVGVDSSEITGKYLWQLPHWSHSENLQVDIQNAVQEVKKRENPINFETTHVDTNGDLRYIEFALTPVQDDKGNLKYIVPEGKDITEKKQAEIRLVQSERNYREIYNSSSDAIIIHDAKTGKIIDVNQTMLEMFGFSYQEALQLEMGNISSGKQQFTQEEAYKKVRKAVDVGPQLFEWLARHKHGACFWVEVSLRNTTIGGIGRVLAVVRDIDKRKQLEDEKKELETLSITDGLTGIANRRRFDEVLLQEYSRHTRTGALLSLILLDIDYFKLFNDYYGHVNGDKCLQQVAGALVAGTNRPADVTARYGGEEFACILPDTDSKSAVEIANKIRQRIISLAIPHKESSIADYVTASFGVVTILCAKEKTRTDIIEQATKIVEQADKLLYRAKSSGRNRVEFDTQSYIVEKTKEDMVGLPWQESYCCGNQIIDAQHQDLFSTSNELLGAILSEQSVSEISVVIDSLLGNSRQHFQDEEKILKTLSFPDISQHAKEHAKLLETGKALSKKFKNSTLSIGDVFQFLVNDLIKQHLLGADKVYFPLMKETNAANSKKIWKDSNQL